MPIRPLFATAESKAVPALRCPLAAPSFLTAGSELFDAGLPSGRIRCPMSEARTPLIGILDRTGVKRWRDPPEPWSAVRDRLSSSPTAAAHRVMTAKAPRASPCLAPNRLQECVSEDSRPRRRDHCSHAQAATRQYRTNRCSLFGRSTTSFDHRSGLGFSLSRALLNNRSRIVFRSSE